MAPWLVHQSLTRKKQQPSLCSSTFDYPSMGTVAVVVSSGRSLGFWVSFCGRSIPIRKSLQVRKMKEVEKTLEPTTRNFRCSANPWSERPSADLTPGPQRVESRALVAVCYRPGGPWRPGKEPARRSLQKTVDC